MFIVLLSRAQGISQAIGILPTLLLLRILLASPALLLGVFGGKPGAPGESAHVDTSTQTAVRAVVSAVLFANLALEVQNELVVDQRETIGKSFAVLAILDDYEMSSWGAILFVLYW